MKTLTGCFRSTASIAVLLVVSACVKSPSELAAQHRNRADAYLQAGRYQDASIEYQAAIQEVPRDTKALFGLARTLDALGQPGEYRDTLRKVLEADPDHPGACLEMGGLVWAAGNYGEALALARRALTNEPTSMVARRLEARALSALGRGEEARAAWNRVIAAEPNQEHPYLESAKFEAWAGDTTRARDILEEGLSRLGNSVRLRLALADLLFLTNDFRGVDVALAEAMELDPENPDVHAARAEYLIRTEKTDAALEWLRTAHGRLSGDREKSVRMALQRARFLVRTGALERAGAVLEEEMEARPRHPHLAAALADVLITQGETKRARELLPLANGLDTSGRTARLLAARLYLVDGRSLWALQLLETLVAKGDMTFDTHYLYAAALAAEERWAKAIGEYRRVLGRVPDHVLVRLDFATLLRTIGDYDGALSQLDEIEARIQATPRVELLRTQTLLGKGEVEAAAQVAGKLLTQAPENATLLTLMADVERGRKRIGRAIELYKKAREINPNALNALFGEVNLLEADGRTREALDLLHEHQHKQGESPQVLNRMASLSFESGNIVTALQTTDRSLLVEPNYWHTRFLRGRILMASGEEAKAVVELEESIKLNPAKPHAYNLLADIYKRRGGLERAEEVYKRLLDNNPGEPGTSNNLANLYLEAGRLEEALNFAREAYAGAYTSPHVLDTLGWVLELSGRSEEAAQFFEAAQTDLGDHPEFLLHWGINLRSRGNGEESRRLFKRVVDLAPASPFAARAVELMGEKI